MSATTDIVDHIVLRSGQIAEATETAAQWVEQHGAALRQDGEALARELRRHGRRALRLHQAARRPMCVAVFGASQAGKSYLVSRLAVAPGGRLAGRFGDATFDFLMDINPPGGQEATGLVTRFTTHPPAAPISTPVTLRLLSQLDLVKILANTYLEDFDIEIVPPDAVALERLFATATAAARPAPVDAFTTGDVEDLGEYFERHFRHHTLLAQLNSVGYWPRVAELAPRLTVADRAALFAPLWGGTPRFTALFRQLADALATLGFSEIAYCGTDALVPRETSIIDVRQLFGIGDEKAVSVSVVTPSGGRAVLDRAVLAALVAELTFPLAEQPWPFFDTTDLLDFPGARTRETITDIDRFLAQPEKLGRAFLRGKVAYLFQRYNAEQEITGMLLCVGPSNQEVQTLPRMVQDWIQLTLGDTPAKREAQRNSLFLVLTKFDAEFEDKAGEEPSTGQRWTARLQASLLDFFGKAYDWPTEWLPGRPFDNLFWLRNPAISFGAVFDYGPPLAPGVPAPEIGVAPRASAAVAVKRSAYLANSLVRRHIAEPEAAWDCALTPNDGGITRLAGALGPVCDPALKATQVSARVEELAGLLAERLRPLWRSDDRAGELVAARARAATVLRVLVECAGAQMFGALLRALQITAEQVAGVYWRMQTVPDDGNMAPVGTVASTADILRELDGLGLLGDPEPAAAQAERLDYFEHFAGLVVAAWDETLQAVAADTGMLTAFRLPAEQAGLMVGQIAAAAGRTDLRGRLAASLRRHASFHGRTTASAGKFVLIAEDMINDFVTYLGFTQMPEASRPVVGGAGPGRRRIFAAREATVGLPELAPHPAPYDRTFYVDWMAAFARIMEDNVSDQSANPIDPAANEAIGAVIRVLAAGAA